MSKSNITNKSSAEKEETKRHVDLLIEGDELLKQNKYKDAMEKYHQAVDMESKYATGHLRIATTSCLLQPPNYELAIEHGLQALQLENTFGYVDRILGNIYFSKGKHLLRTREKMTEIFKNLEIAHSYYKHAIEKGDSKSSEYISQIKEFYQMIDRFESQSVFEFELDDEKVKQNECNSFFPDSNIDINNDDYTNLKNRITDEKQREFIETLTKKFAVKTAPEGYNPRHRFCQVSNYVYIASMLLRFAVVDKDMNMIKNLLTLGADPRVENIHDSLSPMSAAILSEPDFTQEFLNQVTKNNEEYAFMKRGRIRQTECLMSSWLRFIDGENEEKWYPLLRKLYEFDEDE